MVTLSIAEHGTLLAMQTKEALAAKGFRISTKKSPTAGDYLFLPPGTQKNCDILVLHEPDCASGCSGDYFTILNADRKSTINFNRNALVITYGLNSLATLTASSLSESIAGIGFHCCLQRSIVTLRGKILEPQEFPVLLPHTLGDISTAMAFVCLGLVLSLSPEEFLYPPQSL